MTDPRLCSIHLEAIPRRDDYRRAREALLGACGQNTLAIDKDQLAALHARRTLPPGTAAKLHFWLIDRQRDQRAVYALKVGLNTVGRMPDNDVSILDGSVSRRHCAIVIHSSDGCELHDTASKNGTFINGQRISGPTSLKTGDEIRLCDHSLVFLADESDQPPAVEDSNGKTLVES